MNKHLGDILNVLKTKHKASVEEIAYSLKISKQTIRRSLIVMEDEGIIKRYYGGAELITDGEDYPLIVKYGVNNEIKNKLARYAASLIKDNMVVYFDGGSTVSYMIKYISAKNILVVTPNIMHALKLCERRIKVFILPGYIKKTDGTTYSGNESF